MAGSGLYFIAAQIAADRIFNNLHLALYAAIAQLQPQQQELVKRVYFRGEKLADIAREEGVSKAALTNRMKKITAALKKILG